MTDFTATELLRYTAGPRKCGSAVRELLGTEARYEQLDDSLLLVTMGSRVACRLWGVIAGAPEG